MHYVGVDSETLPIAPGRIDPDPVCVSFAEYDLATGQLRRQLLKPKQGYDHLWSCLESRSTTLVGLHIVFDLSVTVRRAPELRPLIYRAYDDGRIYDVGIAQMLLDIAAGRREHQGKQFVLRDGSWVPTDYSLAGSPKVKGSKGLVGLWLGKDRSATKGPDAWRLRYGELAHLPIDEWPADAVSYALDDAQDALDIRNVQPTPVDLFPQCRAAWGLYRMSVRGIVTDREAVASLESKLLAARAKTRKRLIRLGFLVPSPMSAADLRDGKVPDLLGPATKKHPDGRPMRYAKDMAKIAGYVTKVYGRTYDEAPLTETGRVSTARDTLEDSGSRLLAAVGEAGAVDKVLNTYLPVLKAGTETPINGSFNVLVGTGRSSSYRPNLQNLPTGRKVAGTRETIRPRPGYAFLSTDYATLELRTLAQVCLWLFGQSAMAEALQAGRDLHVEMAADLLRISYQIAYDRYQATQREHDPVEDPEILRGRDMAKVGNFGLPGGLGAQGLMNYSWNSYKIRMDLGEATKVRNAWFRTWPEMTKYLRQHIAGLTAGGECVITQFVSGRLRGHLNYTSAANTYFQGLAGDGAKASVYELVKACELATPQTPLWDCYPVVFVHDEVITEVPVGTVHVASLAQETIMRDVMRRYTPDIPIEVKSTIMDRWSKKAKLIHDAQGRRIVWSPSPDSRPAETSDLAPVGGPEASIALAGDSGP